MTIPGSWLSNPNASFDVGDLEKTRHVHLWYFSDLALGLL
jgi:hypothetical protein